MGRAAWLFALIGVAGCGGSNDLPDASAADAATADGRTVAPGDAGAGVDAATALGDAGSCTMAVTQVTNEGWVHVTEGSAIVYAHNPPASGPHYPRWADYIVYDTPFARGYWVHNLEHGGVVLLYRPDAPAIEVERLAAAYADLPVDPECGTSRALLVPDPALDDVVAVVAADWALEGQCVDRSAIFNFVAARRGHGPEDICSGGGAP